jgi:hypothetical protein
MQMQKSKLVKPLFLLGHLHLHHLSELRCCLVPLFPLNLVSPYKNANRAQWMYIPAERCGERSLRLEEHASSFGWYGQSCSLQCFPGHTDHPSSREAEKRGREDMRDER